MEQIYTIPVNEAFEASMEDASCGCALCSLYRTLEENELELILGASMMEPDVRIKTNEQGFCKIHYDMMFVRKNRLGMALTLESHLDEIKRDIKGGGKAGLLRAAGEKPIKRISELEKNCYVCNRINTNFDRMIETAVYLYRTDEEFRKKLKAQPMFCLPHYRMLLERGRDKLSKTDYASLASDTSEVVENYLETLSDDVSWFCKKFDYRYEEEPWYNSKDAVERAIKFLRSDLHAPPSKKKS